MLCDKFTTAVLEESSVSSGHLFLFMFLKDMQVLSMHIVNISREHLNETRSYIRTNTYILL